MAAIPALLTLLVLFAMYAGFAKAAARLYGRKTLSWKSAFGFGAIVGLIAVAGTALRGTLPTVVVLIIGFALMVSVGAWFLASRATDLAGQAVGIKGAAMLSAIAIGMAFFLGIALAVVLPAIAPR